MLNKELRTPVDDLVDFLQERGKTKIETIVSKLRVPTQYVERWLVILEEYGVLKLTYHGFEGYAELNDKNKIKETKEQVDLDKLKEIFLKKSHLKNIDSDKIEKLWVLFLRKYDGEIKDLFVEKAKKRGYNSKQIELAWGRYRRELEVL